MVWLIYAYVLCSIGVSITLVFNTGLIVGAYALIASHLFVISGGGLSASLWWGDWSQRIGGTLFAAMLAALAHWLSSGFSVEILYQHFTGELWGWTGFLVSFLCADKRIAGIADNQPRGRTIDIMRRVVRAAAFAMVVVVVAMALVGTRWRDDRFEYYARRLDLWVSSGGSKADIQREVVEICGKLVVSQAGVIENVGFMTVDRDELDFRVDVCTKMTVNRLYAQPEFEKPELVAMTCAGKNQLFQRLCRRSGLKASSAHSSDSTSP